MKLGNHAVKLDGTVLYADLADSTGLVSKRRQPTGGGLQVLPPLHSKIIKHYGGIITAFDGDRVMAVYIATARTPMPRHERRRRSITPW